MVPSRSPGYRSVDELARTDRVVAQNYGPIQITGIPQGSLGPGKFDISDAPAQIGHYDPDTPAFVAS